MRRFVASLLALAALAAAAHADPAAPEPDQPRDRTQAISLSAGTTVTSLIVTLGGIEAGNKPAALVGAAGLLLGPSAGQWYAGKILTPGLGLRLAGAGIATVAVVAALRDDDADDRQLSGAVYVGGALVVAGAIYDIATAGSAVDDWNRAHAHRATLAPTAMSTAHGLAPGLAIVGTF